MAATDRAGIDPSLAQDIEQQLQRIWEQVCADPEKAQSYFGLAVKTLLGPVKACVDAIKHCNDYSTRGAALQKIRESLDKFCPDACAKTTDIINNMEKELGGFCHFRSHIQDACSRAREECAGTQAEVAQSIDKLKKDILQSVEQGHDELVRKMMSNAIALDLAFIALQCFNLWDTWRNVKRAQNLVKDAAKFAIIEKRLGELEAMVVQMVQASQRGDVRDASVLSRQASRRVAQLQGLINGVKSKIDGAEKNLNIYSTRMVTDGIGNALFGVAGVVRMYSMWENLSQGHIWACGVCVAMFAALAVGNAYTYTLTESTLEGLRCDAQVLKGFQTRVDNLSAHLEELENVVLRLPATATAIAATAAA